MLQPRSPQLKHEQIRFITIVDMISSATIMVLSAVILSMSFFAHISSETIINITYCLAPVAAISGLVFTIQVMIRLNVEKHRKPIKGLSLSCCILYGILSAVAILTLFMLFGLTIAPIITVVVGFIMQFATPALFLVLVVLQYIIYFLNNKK